MIPSTPTASGVVQTLASKIWQQRLVAGSGRQHSLLHIDRVFAHERTGPTLLVSDPRSPSMSCL